MPKRTRLRESAATAVLDPPGDVVVTAEPVQAGLQEAVSNKPWSGFAAADYDDAQWRKACLVDRGDDIDGKERYSLPVLEPSGALNRNGAHAAAARIHSLKGVPADKVKAAARKLVTLYRNQLDEEPPERLLTLAGLDEAVTSAGRPGTVALREAAGNLRKTGRRRYLARIIEADRWGASGYYSKAILARYAAAAWPAGTLMNIDHPTVTEQAERPEGSIRNLAAFTVTDPVMRDDGPYVEIEVFPHAEQLVESLWDKVGLSIKADGTVEYGTVAGKSGPIVTEIHPGLQNSIDFVTKAGAGGKVVALLESARATALREAASFGGWLESRLHLMATQLGDDAYGEGRLTRPERITLSAALGDALKAYCARIEAQAPQLYERGLYDEAPPEAAAMAPRMPATTIVREAAAEEVRRALDAALRATYGREDTYVWVRDYDPDKGVVWYELTEPDECRTWQETYRIGDGGQLTLAGDRCEVVVRTVYQPVMPGQPLAYTGGRVAVIEAITPPESSAAPSAEPVSDGMVPTAPNPPTQEETSMSGTPTTAPVAGAAGAATGTAPADHTTALREAERARDTALREAADTRQELARYRAQDAARPLAEQIVGEVADFPPAARARVLAEALRDIPLTESLALDTETFRTRVAAQVTAEQAYLAQLQEAAGAGTVRGFGTTPGVAGQPVGPTVDAEKVQAQLAEAFVARGMSPEAAKIAAAGRPN